MLTGPVTILQWSFVRDDQPRRETCRQIALAIRDEVMDLERAGVKMIQIDEAALREGLPIRKAEWQAYLDWAVEAFRLAAGGRETANPDPHPYVLFGVQRHHRGRGGDGCRCDFDRDVALGDETAGCLRRFFLPQRYRAGRL